MTKSELQSKINEVKSLLGQLEGELTKVKEWPQNGDNYLYISPVGEIEYFSFDNDRTDYYYRTAHNMFRPEHEEFVARLGKKQAFQRLLEKTAYEANSSGSPKERNAKFFLMLRGGSIMIGSSILDYNSGLAYFYNHDDALKAISLIGEEVLQEGFAL